MTCWSSDIFTSKFDSFFHLSVDFVIHGSFHLSASLLVTASSYVSGSSQFTTEIHEIHASRLVALLIYDLLIDVPDSVCRFQFSFAQLYSANHPLYDCCFHQYLAENLVLGEVSVFPHLDLLRHQWDDRNLLLHV